MFFQGHKTQKKVHEFFSTQGYLHLGRLKLLCYAKDGLEIRKLQAKIAQLEQH